MFCSLVYVRCLTSILVYHCSALDHSASAPPDIGAISLCIELYITKSLFSGPSTSRTEPEEESASTDDSQSPTGHQGFKKDT